MKTIECKELMIGYDRDQPLTEAFNLSLVEGQWVGIIGENGTGKSTFLKTILGHLDPLHGEVSVFKDKVGDNNKQISYIPQEREINVTLNMSGLTLIKNSYQAWHYGLPSFGKKINQKAYELLDLVGATSYMHKPFSHLSGGQKKRIYLAQALINNPKILLLDEPLADLDPKAKLHFIEALCAIRKAQNLSLLIISHDMHEIASYLDGFVHFKQQKVHYCNELPCIKQDTYVGE